MTPLATLSADSAKTESADSAKTDPTQRVPESARSFELAPEVQLLRDGPQYRLTGHAARTLFKSPALRIVLIVLRRDAELKEHKTDEPVAIQVLEGRVRVALPDRAIEPAAGGLVVVEPGVLHDVIAVADSTILLSIPWSDHTRG